MDTPMFRDRGRGHHNYCLTRRFHLSPVADDGGIWQEAEGTSMNLNRLFLFFFLTGLLGYSLIFPARCVALSADEIMHIVYSQPEGEKVVAEIEMTLIGKDGGKRIRRMKIFKQQKEAVRKNIIFFLEPADVRNTALLTYDYTQANQDDEQWIYLPSLHKTKRISSSNKSASFMGSDISYADLTRHIVENFSYSLTKESQVDSHPVWVIESIPKNETISANTGYSKSVLLVRQDNFVIIRAVHWMRNTTSLKYVEVKKLQKIDTIWVPMEIHATVVADKKILHQTILQTQSIQFNQTIDDDFFTVRSMEKGL